MRDKYDEAIAYLTEHPGEIISAWREPDKVKGGCLFQYADKSGRGEPGACGCLTMIRDKPDIYGVTLDDEEAWCEELTCEIANDERIPYGGEHITVADLLVFAEWQRRLDKELGRC